MFTGYKYVVHIVKSITKILKQGNNATHHLIIQTSYEQSIMLDESLSRVLRSVEIQLRDV